MGEPGADSDQFDATSAAPTDTRDRDDHEPAPASDTGEEPAGLDPVEDHEPVSDRTTLVIGAVMAVVAIALVSVLVATGGGDSGGAGGGAANGDDGEVRPTTAVFGTLDEFSRAGENSLGSFTRDREWQPYTGRWGIDDGDARVVESHEYRNHATIGLGESDGAVQVRLDRLTAGAGIVFRFRGPSNYWAVVASPNGGSWNLLRVEDTEKEFIGNTGITPVVDGTTVAARFVGEQIDVIVNGVVRLTVQDDYLIDEGQVGMTVDGEDATEARFDDFVAALPGNRPLYIGGDGAAAPTTTADGD